jgi:ATP-binding cassette subfamily C (CFTR/MRP) protein 4
VISAPTAFVDVNPTGRILNRFSKDLAVLDDALPLTFYDFANIALACLGILALLAAVNPWLLLLIAPLAYAFFRLRAYYTAVSRVVKRLEAASRSPIFSLLAECTSGLPSVRAFNLGALALERFYAAADENGRAYWAWLATTRWLGVRLDSLCLALLTCTTFLGVALRDSGERSSSVRVRFPAAATPSPSATLRPSVTLPTPA